MKFHELCGEQVAKHYHIFYQEIVQEACKRMFWKWLFQTYTFFEEIHGMCKHQQIVIFHIFLENVYNMFEQCKILFVYLHISPSPCNPLIYFVNYPFHSRFPMFWFWKKCQRGSSIVSFLRYSNFFFVISHILSSMVEINVYSIIDSKMFSVTFGVDFLLPIVDKSFTSTNTF